MDKKTKENSLQAETYTRRIALALEGINQSLATLARCVNVDGEFEIRKRGWA